MPNYYSPYQQMYQPNYFQNTTPQQSTPATTQIQNGGFVSVRNENEARNYPIAYGNSVTFKDENAPYIYVKTMGFSQLDNPVFDKYRLVKEQPVVPENGVENSESYKLSYEELKAEIEAIKEQIEALKERVDNMNNVSERTKAKSKKEMIDDE